MNEDVGIDPWSSDGETDYSRIVNQFGLEMVDQMERDECPDGYERIDRDLNTGSDGSAVYIYFKRKESDDEKVIIGISLLTDKMEVPEGWEKVENDLNDGVSSVNAPWIEPTFLAIKRED